MTLNSSQVLYFTLTAYVHSRSLRYFYFLVTLLLFVLILGANLLLIVVICMNRSLHEPMYMFLCSLFVSEIFGSTSVIPLILVQLLLDVHIVSVPHCRLQIYFLHSYGAVEFLNLAVMSFDRHQAICCPLHYNARMTLRRTSMLIAAAWLYSLLACVAMLSHNVSLQLCGNVINQLYCDNYSVLKLSCSDITGTTIYGLLISSITIGGPVAFIIYCYLRILKVCYSGSKETRQKAISTCSPQLASVISFTFSTTFTVLQSRFNMNALPSMLRAFLSIYWLICQPLLNPLLYGLKMSKIRIGCKNLLFT